MKRVNIELVRQRAREIRESTDKVRQYATQPDEAFFSDERNLYTVMHLLLLAIEAMAAICNHILAKTAHKAPGGYTDCFIGLETLDVLDHSLVQRLVQAARFRNLLVHRYWQVDPQRVLAYARQNLGDFETFLEQVGQWLGQEPGF
jgi:uncharacterized protein YutE (UPF0331/DUF86 family)